MSMIAAHMRRASLGFSPSPEKRTDSARTPDAITRNIFLGRSSPIASCEPCYTLNNEAPSATPFPDERGASAPYGRRQDPRLAHDQAALGALRRRAARLFASRR